MSVREMVHIVVFYFFPLRLKWQLAAYTLHHCSHQFLFLNPSISSPFLELLQYQVDARSG